MPPTSPTTPEGVSLNVEGWTPGPWRVEERGVGAGVSHFIMARLHTPVARTVSQQSSDAAIKEQVRANARLIAAAPDLYRLLAESVAQMEIVRQKLTDAGVGNLGAGALGRQCDVARAALSSAQRGRL